MKSHDNSATHTNTQLQCKSQCCKDREFPFQPRATHTKKRQGKQNRSFNTGWYRDHKWLSFCTSQGKVFCFYCRKAACEGLLPSGSRIDSSLITIGLDNWKKAKDKFKAHEKAKLIVMPCLHTKHLNSLLSQQFCPIKFLEIRNTIEIF